MQRGGPTFFAQDSSLLDWYSRDHSIMAVHLLLLVGVAPQHSQMCLLQSAMLPNCKVRGMMQATQPRVSLAPTHAPHAVRVDSNRTMVLRRRRACPGLTPHTQVRRPAQSC